MASVDAQLKRLQTDYIDVYQVHRLDPHTPIEETMYSLDQIVRSGKVRYIGGSTMPAYKFAQMVMVADWKGYARPIAMQNLYNLIQREEEREMNRLCHEQGVGLIPYSPLARGFLAGNRSQGRRRRDRALEERHGGARPALIATATGKSSKRLKKIAEGKNATPAQAALAWLLQQALHGLADHRRHRASTSSPRRHRSTEYHADGRGVPRLLEEPYQFRVSPESWTAAARTSRSA